MSIPSEPSFIDVSDYQDECGEDDIESFELRDDSDTESESSDGVDGDDTLYVLNEGTLSDSDAGTLPSSLHSSTK